MSLMICPIEETRAGAWQLWLDCLFQAVGAIFGVAFFGAMTVGGVCLLAISEPVTFRASAGISFLAAMTAAMGWLLNDAIRGPQMQLARTWFSRFPSA